MSRTRFFLSKDGKVVADQTLMMKKSEVDKLIKEVNDLRADKERMDWCDKNLSGLTLLGKSMREYVDAARKEQS